jgi:hypothetical protein
MVGSRRSWWTNLFPIGLFGRCVCGYPDSFSLYFWLIYLFLFVKHSKLLAAACSWQQGEWFL